MFYNYNDCFQNVPPSWIESMLHCIQVATYKNIFKQRITPKSIANLYCGGMENGKV